jgi:hypothetical protein
MTRAPAGFWVWDRLCCVGILCMPRLLHRPLKNARNRVSCSHGGGHQPCHSLAREAGYCTREKKPGFLPPLLQSYCVRHKSLSRQASCGRMSREETGGNRSLRSEREGRQCQSVD